MLNNNNFLTNEDVIQQLPGLVMVLDPMNRFISCNNSTVQELGFKSREEILGLTIYEQRTKGVECADIFASQNKAVITNGISQTVLDIHPYANDRVLMLLTKKALLFDTHKNITGVLISGMEINRNALLNVSMAIANSDKKYRPKNSIKQRSYNISNQFNEKKLSAREAECLFYLIRGKTVHAISNILKLSKRTIEFYVNNIRNKMDCTSKSHLIEKAIENNLINIIPKSFFTKDINISVVID